MSGGVSPRRNEDAATFAGGAAAGERLPLILPRPAGATMSTAMGELIWSIVAVIASIAVCFVVVYYLIAGRYDRVREEEAREFFDRHGHWPDEKPT